MGCWVVMMTLISRSKAMRDDIVTTQSFRNPSMRTRESGEYLGSKLEPIFHYISKMGAHVYDNLEAVKNIKFMVGILLIWMIIMGFYVV